MPDQDEIKGPINSKMIEEAEQLLGLKFTPAEHEQMLKILNDRLEQYDNLRKISLDNSIPPAVQFSPVVDHTQIPQGESEVEISKVDDVERPSDLEDVAFYSVPELSKLIQTREVSSVELTEMYLERLKRYDPHLQCVVTFTEELAFKQARHADEEIAQGVIRGPLHGIPWGAKDLLATKNYPTTWGAMPFKDQLINRDAEVVKRLAEAGAVLIAKLTLGALAYGDVWFGGVTKSPWNHEDGSSGSSAGPASATSGGLVGFSIGSETLGSIVSPSHRCGTTGLRPTFGRVSREGAMALSWSMDKLGPICRNVEDCALVFDAIYGPDGVDLSLINAPFSWDADRDLTGLRIGYVQSAFEEEHDSKPFDDATLDVLKSLGVEMIPVGLPEFPYAAMRIILLAEAAAAFEDLTRSNKDDLLVKQDDEGWPNIFRAARFIPAVEYIHANRLRTLVMEQMRKIFNQVDVYACPSYGADNLTLTNLTGHPCVVIPNGFGETGTPASSITFMANLFKEEDALLVAKAVQDATDFHTRIPGMAYIS